MCTGKPKAPPKPQPLPPPPPLAEPGQAAPIIDEGQGVAQKIADIRSSNPLLAPIRTGGDTSVKVGKIYRTPFVSGQTPVAPGTGFINLGLQNWNGKTLAAFRATKSAKFSDLYLRNNKLGGYG